MNRNITIIVWVSFLLVNCEKTLIGPGPENTAEGNYDVLWQTVDEKYGLFPISHVNWDSLYTVYRSQISPNTNNEELWEICCNLLSHLGNGHIYLANENFTKGFCPDNPDPNIRLGASLDLIKTRYLQNVGITGEGFITYGKLKDYNIGYIYILSFSGVPNGRNWIGDLDEVVRILQDCDGMIIDVRNNGGGFSKNDLYAASLFIDKDVTYYYSRLKTGPGHNDFGEVIAKKVSPQSEKRCFTKKNVLLTNRFTASGAEAFALILRTLDYSIHIGDTTMGAIGEVTHVAQLPNGWILKYPCTLTTLADGSSPENIGIPPDIVLDNTQEDVAEGKDILVERSIDLLTEFQ